MPKRKRKKYRQKKPCMAGGKIFTYEGLYGTVLSTHPMTRAEVEAFEAFATYEEEKAPSGGNS